MEGTGKHTISMEQGKGDGEHMYILCGVARDGVACDKGYFNKGSTEAY